MKTISSEINKIVQCSPKINNSYTIINIKVVIKSHVQLYCK